MRNSPCLRPPACVSLVALADEAEVKGPVEARVGKVENIVKARCPVCGKVTVRRPDLLLRRQGRLPDIRQLAGHEDRQEPHGERQFNALPLELAIKQVRGSVLAIAIMGKLGFETMKHRIFGFLKKHGPADRVSLARHRIGLVMFVMPLLFGWLSPYLQGLFPQIDAHRNLLAITGDLLLVGSLFVLGGDFWDKVRSLFVHDAIAVLPEKPE